MSSTHGTNWEKASSLQFENQTKKTGVQLHLRIERCRGLGTFYTYQCEVFIGFVAANKSVQGIFQNLAPLKYVLIYKLSQDHLERVFSAVRSAGGFSNNPTTQQFMAAYKRLLFRSTIKRRSRKCISNGQHHYSRYCWRFVLNIQWQNSYHI